MAIARVPAVTAGDSDSDSTTNFQRVMSLALLPRLY